MAGNEHERADDRRMADDAVTASRGRTAFGLTLTWPLQLLFVVVVLGGLGAMFFIGRWTSSPPIDERRSEAIERTGSRE